MSFKEVPDYEKPTDADADNLYDFSITVTDVSPSSNTPILFEKNIYTNGTDDESNTQVRVTNFDEDIISFSLTGDDGTETQGPKIYIDMEIDSYTKPLEIQVLLWRGETQYWTNASVVSEENFIVDFSYVFDVPTNSPSGTWEVRKVRLIAEDNEYDYSNTLIGNKGFTTSLYLYNPNSDENDPELVSFGEFEVKGNDSDPSTNITVTMTAKVTDQENGLDTAYGSFMGPGGGTATDYGSVNTALSPNEASYEWVLDPKTASGEYKLADLRFSDKAGNKVTILTSALEDYGDPYISISNPIGDNDTPQLSDFKLAGSVASNGRKTITLRTLIDNGADQETSIKRQYLRVIGPDGRIDKDSFVQQEDGWWELSFELGLEAQDGEYNISYWFIRDNALNNIQLSTTDLNDRGFATKLTFKDGLVTVGDDESSSSTIYYLYGGSSQSTYLGCYGCGSSNAESICNESGTYGSSVGVSSIWNTVGTYGSTVGTNSPWNSVGTNPPEFFNNKDKTSSYGKFTINTVTANRTNITKLTNVLDFFNNTNDNHSATRNYACSVSETSINVTVAPNNNGSGNVYVINGVQKPSLTLERGKSYTFEHPSEHPFRFSNTSDGTHGFGLEYTDDVAKSNGSTTIAVGSSTPTTLYYYCSIHSGMGGSISIN